MVLVAQAYEVVRINNREKGVDLDGQGEATCGHELYPNERRDHAWRYGHGETCSRSQRTNTTLSLPARRLGP